MEDTVFLVQEIEWGCDTGVNTTIKGIAKSYEGARKIFEECKQYATSGIHFIMCAEYNVETDNEDFFYAEKRNEDNVTEASYRLVITEMPLQD